MIGKTSNQSNNQIMISITLLIAAILMVVPLPVNPLYRPDVMLLTLLYWAMALPNRVNILLACFWGAIVDLMLGGTLGSHSLGYSLSVYIIIRFHLQLRQYPIMQQTLVILVNVFMVNITTIWLAQKMHFELATLMPTIITTLLWPFVFIILRHIRRYFHIE